MPLSATRVIHRLFSERHQASSARAMDARCDIVRPSTGRGTLDKSNGTVTNPGTDIGVDVPCRITAKPGDERSTPSGGQDATWRRYLLAIEADIDLMPGDVVTPTVARDAAIVGRTLYVVDVQYGTETWQRTATLTDTLAR